MVKTQHYQLSQKDVPDGLIGQGWAWLYFGHMFESPGTPFSFKVQSPCEGAMGSNTTNCLKSITVALIPCPLTTTHVSYSSCCIPTGYHRHLNKSPRKLHKSFSEFFYGLTLVESRDFIELDVAFVVPP